MLFLLFSTFFDSWHDSHHLPSLVADGQVSLATHYTSRPCRIARTLSREPISEQRSGNSYMYLHYVLFVASKICPRLLLSRGSGGWFGCQFFFFFFFFSLPSLLFSSLLFRRGAQVRVLSGRGHTNSIGIHVGISANWVADQPRILGKGRWIFTGGPTRNSQRWPGENTNVIITASALLSLFAGISFPGVVIT